MKHVQSMYSPKPDVSEWSTPALDAMQDALFKAVSEVIHTAMEDRDTCITFPIESAKDESRGIEGGDGYGGPEVQDPLTVYLRIALNGGIEHPVYSFNLREALEYSLDVCGKDGSYSAGLGKLSTALRELADEIDDAIAKGAEQESDT